MVLNNAGVVWKTSKVDGMRWSLNGASGRLELARSGYTQQVYIIVLFVVKI